MAKPVSEMTEEEAKAEKREQQWQAHKAKVLAGQHQEAMSELEAMSGCLVTLHPLPADSQKRVLRWLADRLDNFTPPIASFNGYYSDEPPF